jgi:capsular polysaccharide biosynthesis protein
MTPHDRFREDRLPGTVEMVRMQGVYSPAYGPGEEDQEESKVRLSQYLWILKRYRWRIGAFIAAAVLGTLLISVRLTPIYESTATVDVDRQVPPGVVGQDASRTVLNDSDQFLATQIKLVQSDSVLRPVDRKFHLRELEKQSEASGSPRGEASPVALKQLKVTRPPNTYLIQVNYRSADPQLAADAANAITQSYLEHTYTIRLRSSASVASFMERQMEELRAKMERSSQALSVFERELNVINPEEKTNIFAARLLQLNTEYTQPQPAKGTPPERYFHFDSWRMNVEPGLWVPAEIYVEEAGDAQKGPAALPRFKAQTRFWDFNAKPANKLDELTSILVEQSAGVKDQDSVQDVSPLESQRSWERQAEENILARLQGGGFLAPPGAVEDVLNTVVNNLIVSANLNVEAHCRVLLTTPVETFSIGHTIVISRGLIDILPDEVSLALVLADELSHIALGHRTQTQFAFHSQTMLSDSELLQKFRFERSPEEMIAAGKKTVEIMKASPYQKTANAGVFLKALGARAQALPRLLAANLGNQVADHDSLARLQEFAATAPALDESKIEQIAALPLGSRVKLNPWNNQIVLVKTRPLALLSAREKMPFEVTPFALHLTRVDAEPAR